MLSWPGQRRAVLAHRRTVGRLLIVRALPAMPDGMPVAAVAQARKMAHKHLVRPQVMPARAVCRRHRHPLAPEPDEISDARLLGTPFRHDADRSRAPRQQGAPFPE